MSSMSLRVKRTDGSVIRDFVNIYQIAGKHGFVFTGRAYVGKQYGVALSGTLKYTGQEVSFGWEPEPYEDEEDDWKADFATDEFMAAADSALTGLMAELGPVCVGNARPRIWNSAGPCVTVMVSTPEG